MVSAQPQQAGEPSSIDAQLTELIRMTHWVAAECRLEDLSHCVEQREMLLGRLQSMQEEGQPIAPETRRLLGALDGATSELMLSLSRCYRERFAWLASRQPEVGNNMPELSRLLGPLEPIPA